MICLSGDFLRIIMFGFTIICQIESQVLFPWIILPNQCQIIVTNYVLLFGDVLVFFGNKATK